MAISNAIFNQFFIFELRVGYRGLGSGHHRGAGARPCLVLGRCSSDRAIGSATARISRGACIGRGCAQQFLLGFPMGLLYAADLIGAALFQIMQVKLGAADGAATQIATMLTSIAYLPGVGIALAGTTLVGQSIGAGDRDWAMRVGTRVIALAAPTWAAWACSWRCADRG